MTMPRPTIHPVLAKVGAAGLRISAVLSLGVLALAGCQSLIIYYPRSYTENTLARARATGVVPIPFETNQGSQIAHLLPARELSEDANAATLWIVTAGNGSLALDYLDDTLAWQAVHPNSSFLFVDYPGYGNCQGKPDPGAITESLDAAHARIKTTGQTGRIEHLGCFGHSLGAAAALIAAERLGADRIILLSPFTSMADMAEKQFGKWARFLVRHRFDNRARMKALADREDVEIIIFHGESDNLVPASMSHELSESFPKIISALHLVQGAGHNDIMSMAGHSIAREVTRPFAIR